jgi:hypothetical protein
MYRRKIPTHTERKSPIKKKAVHRIRKEQKKCNVIE